MSPTRRQVLAAIAGAATAATVGPASALPESHAEPEVLDGMIVFRGMEPFSEFAVMVRIETDPSDGSVLVDMNYVCDSDIGATRLYGAGDAEALLRLLADGNAAKQEYLAKERACRAERNAA